MYGFGVSSTAQRLPATDSQLRVVVLYGGQSPEHEVSRVTAAHVLAAIDRNKYHVSAVGIDRQGVWHQLAELPDPQQEPTALEVVGTTGVAVHDPAARTDRGPALDPWTDG